MKHESAFEQHSLIRGGQVPVSAPQRQQAENSVICFAACNSRQHRSCSSCYFILFAFVKQK